LVLSRLMIVRAVSAHYKIDSFFTKSADIGNGVKICHPKLFKARIKVTNLIFDRVSTDKSFIDSI
jgi:hypothetical protein